ncbi:hypothetical protein D3C81_2139470 [compost metagenome]
MQGQLKLPNDGFQLFGGRIIGLLEPFVIGCQPAQRQLALTFLKLYQNGAAALGLRQLLLVVI